MLAIISVLQIIVSLFLIGAILLSSKGTGLGVSFEGVGTAYRSKRGIERILFFGTIVLSTLFLAISLVGVLIK